MVHCETVKKDQYKFAIKAGYKKTKDEKKKEKGRKEDNKEEN